MSTQTTQTTHPPETNFNTITSWLPLTTPFTPQADCSSLYWARLGFNPSGGFNQLAVAFDIGYVRSVNASVTCLPEQVTSWWATGDASLTSSGVTTRYSVGPVVCPDMYQTVGTSVLGAGRTQVVCCPRSYTFAAMQVPGIIGECTSPISAGATITYVMEATPAADFSAGDPVKTTSTVMSKPYYIVGIPLNGINFAQAVVSTTSSSSSVQTSSSGSSSTQTSSNTVTVASNTAPASSSNSSSGLSTGAKAGIGVGVSLVALAVIAFLAFFLLGRRKRAAELREGGPVPELEQAQETEWKFNEPEPPKPPVELGSTYDGRHELGTHYDRPELAG